MSNGRRRAFTLIELLVVVAIIALLISILLPSLSRAREQAKIAKCLSNHKTLGLASFAYGADNRDEYPWGIKQQPAPYSFNIYSELIYAGAMPNKSTSELNAAGQGMVASSDVYKVPARLRPMNKYITPEVTWDKEPGGQNKTPREEYETPGFFICPSDRTPNLPFVGAANPLPEYDQAFPMWEYWGNSYPINWYWPYYYYKVSPGDKPPYSGSNQFLNILGVLNPPSLGVRMMRNKAGRFSTDFILFMDADFNYVIANARPPGYTGSPWGGQPRQMIGWHGGLGRHSVAFLDGHAEHKFFDTRSIFGDDWTIWPNKPWDGGWAAFNDKLP